VDRHDRRVIEARLDLRLAEEPRGRRVRPRSAAHPLERHAATDLPITRERHLTHPAASEDLGQLVSLRRPPELIAVNLVGAIGLAQRRIL
jgi:hypothetical protein